MQQKWDFHNLELTNETECTVNDMCNYDTAGIIMGSYRGA